MSTKEQRKALLAGVLIALGFPANFIWWRFVYDILALGESEGEQFAVLNLVCIGFCATCIAFAAYAIGVMEGDK